MNGAFYIGAAGLRAQEQAVQITANNIANWNTPAFKRTRVRFADLAPAAGDAARVGAAIQSPASGVRLDAAQRDMQAGVLRGTGDAFDVAIDGAGFIEVLGENGQTLLWRGGRLKVDANGRLATLDGYVLKSLIETPEGYSDLRIDPQGVVTVTLDRRTEQIGRIDLALARDETALVSIGAGLFKSERPEDLLTATPGDGAGVLAQGFEEGSNVRLSDEMVLLLLSQRAFAANSQVVQAADQLMSIANGLRR